MTGFVRFKYWTVRWNPPHWSLDDEIAMGKEVRRLGKSGFNRKFRKNLLQSLTQDPSGKRSPTRIRSSMGKDIAVIIATLSIIGLLCFFFPYAFLVAAVCALFASVMYCGSAAIAMWKYDRWLRACQKKYMEPLEGRPVLKEIIQCRCGQELRIPCTTKRLKITCPACGYQFKQ
jgi:hypothetical protein